VRAAGIDLGSRTVKLVALDDDGAVAFEKVAEATFDPLAVCAALIAEARFDAIAATGYGRHLFARLRPGAEAITEIKAVALGARALHPTCRAIVDVGGQDTKAVALDGGGRVLKFAMNDKCAAGTGRFLEVMATALAFTPTELVAAALVAGAAEKLSSMCTVFAESEVVSLVARGARRDEIALGLHRAIAQRTAGLAGTVPLEDDILFTGGGALNACLVRELQATLRRSIVVPRGPQTVAALGAALYARENATDQRPR
jgi:(R)-2-hydroxyacyl-CoA dehydratese activating ATPase